MTLARTPAYYQSALKPRLSSPQRRIGDNIFSMSIMASTIGFVLPAEMVHSFVAKTPLPYIQEQNM